MIARDATPIAHTPPLKRVDLGFQGEGYAKVQPGSPTIWDMSMGSVSPVEADRIMDLVRQTATGTNPPAHVDSSGWEAA